jgi:hypothetical protein
VTTLALQQFQVAPSGGTSNTADFIADQILKWRRRLQDSNVLGQQIKGAISELHQVFAKCYQPGWDGYGAAPISIRTFQSAQKLLETLPLGTPAPSIGAEPDGHITLEWHHSPHRTLSVSVSPEDELHYAALIGNSKQYGTEPFYGQLPLTISNLIHRVLAL